MSKQNKHNNDKKNQTSSSNKSKDESNNIKEVKKEAKPVQAQDKNKKPDTATKSVEKVLPKLNTTTSKSATSKKKVITNMKKKPNYVGIASAILIIIPCLVLAYLLLGSHGNSNEPVEGNRFTQSLDPAISDSEVVALKESLTFENVDTIDVSLKSATLRININVSDDSSEETIKEIMNMAYDAAIAKFPVETYFTNKTNSDETVSKMYDLQVTVYNYIAKTDEEKEGQIQVIRTKNAAAKSDIVDVVSTPKNPEVSEGLLNPDTSQIPEQETE